MVFHRIHFCVPVPPQDPYHEGKVHEGTERGHVHDPRPTFRLHGQVHGQAGEQNGEARQERLQLRGQVRRIEAGRVGGPLAPDGPEDGKVQDALHPHLGRLRDGQPDPSEAGDDDQVEEEVAQRDRLAGPGPLVVRHPPLHLGQDLGRSPHPSLVPWLVAVLDVLREARRLRP